MFENLPGDTRNVLYALGTIFLVGFILSSLLLVWVLWRIKKINLPPGADFMTALRATPLAVVLLLDALDMSLDIFGTPVAWVVLGKLGLQPLRTVTTVEAFIPGTQLIPLMTLSWLAARLLKSTRWG